MTDGSLLLERTLRANLTWNKARIKFLSQFLLALTQTRSVNLVRLAAKFGGPAKTASSYKRLQRFLHFFDFPFVELARFLIQLMKLAPPFVVIIDRTEWKFGPQGHNILTLALAAEDVAVPLWWHFLGKKGCSDNSEREAIMRALLSIFPVSQIKYVCADREFASVEWLRFLTAEKIPYRLHIKAHHQLTSARGRVLAARKILRTARVGTAVICRGRHQLWGQYWVYVAGRKRADGENLLFISNEEAPQMMAEDRQRWQIETLFGCLKSRGFDLEGTHLADAERLGKLLGVLAVAVCWSWLAGEKIRVQKPITRKKHGRRAKSVFRVGLDYLEELFGTAGRYSEKRTRKEFILILSCT